MITNKDLSIDSKNGQVILNGDKYDLGTQGDIDAAVKDVYSVMGEMGAKNLIPRPYADGEKKSQNNMTYTVNTDGTITATATQALTGDTTFYLYGPTETEELVLKAGVKYVLSGDPTAIGVERIVVAGRSAAGGTSEMLIINNTGVPKEYTPDEDKVITSIYIRNYTSTTTPYNETFEPMLRLASDTDNTYQPYAKTNRQLTEVIGDLSGTGITGDSVAEQLITVFDKVKILTPVDENYTCQSTNLEYTGLSVACPAGHVYIVRAQISYTGSVPTEICACSSSATVQGYLSYARSDKTSFITFMLTAGETAYIWGKWAEANKQNAVRYNIIDVTI